VNFAPPAVKTNCSVKKFLGLFAVLMAFAGHAFAASADYKSVLVETNGDAIRIRLPLTDVTGKVRVKEKSSDGFGLPVAPMKTFLNEKFYLEWQIGYDIPGTNSPTVVPEIKFVRNGETGSFPRRETWTYTLL